MQDPPRRIFIKGDKAFWNVYIIGVGTQIEISKELRKTLILLLFAIPEKLTAFRVSPSLYPCRQGENICHEPKIFEIHKNVWRFERMILKLTI